MNNDKKKETKKNLENWQQLKKVFPLIHFIHTLKGNCPVS